MLPPGPHAINDGTDRMACEDPLPPGAGATPAAVLVTLLTPPPDREMTDLFDRVNGPAAAGAEEIR